MTLFAGDRLRYVISFSILFASAAVLSCAFSPGALACASCGSGGDDPLILYPNQDWRFYFATSRVTGFKTVKTDGSLGKEAAPQFKDALTLAVGKAIRPDAFVTVTLPYLQNWRDGAYKRSFGDPIFAARWSVVMQDIAEPWIPQVQIMFAHRFAVAKAQQESVNAYRLDSFGQGVPETKMGVDLFQGMTDFKIGAAYSFLLPGERNLAGVDYNPGLGQRGVFTAGYGRSGIGKALVGLTRETRAEKRLNGVEVNGSRTVDNGVFVTADWEVTGEHMARLTWARRSAVFKNRNGSRSDGFTLAWMWAVAP